MTFGGENIDNLNKKFNLPSNSRDLSRIREYLFLIGEKARAYRKSCVNKIEKKYKLFGIKEVTPTVFNYIFTKYNKLLKKMDKPEVVAFCLTNPSLAAFINLKVNRQKFIDEISKFAYAKKILVRDYYLTALHQAGVAGFYNN